MVLKITKIEDKLRVVEDIAGLIFCGVQEIMQCCLHTMIRSLSVVETPSSA